ncbi:MAG: 4Fe-4S binding protein [Spirochaetia bacterium]|nr:4Fe-4S binding protein [Spirochaetia bacterium]
METQMATGMETTFLGIRMQSPFIIGSGPASYDAEAMMTLHGEGAGAVVTKTMRFAPAHNPVRHIAKTGTSDSLINCELWSDLPYTRLVEEEIPRAVQAGVNVIASIGHTPAEANQLVPLATKAGACAIELVSYEEETMLEMVRQAKDLTDLPIIAKLSPNWPGYLKLIPPLEEAGIAAITAMDSVGPVLRIDIHTGRPLVEGKQGRGWLSGAAIKPIILNHVALLAQQTDLPIIGLGGVCTAEDAVEMSMAGAQAIGICSVVLIKGHRYIAQLIKETNALVHSLGYENLRQTCNVFNFNLAKEVPSYHFSFDAVACVGCRRCDVVCPYQAQQTGRKHSLAIDESRCRNCGLCASVCPKGALAFSL